MATTSRAGIRARDLVREACRAIPRADAEFLLMSLLGASRHILYEDVPVTPCLASRFRRCVSRVRTGQPVQYACGKAPFLDFDVVVNHKVLIPRPETEELVLRAVGRLRGAGTTSCAGTADTSVLLSAGPVTVPSPLALDYGTGSGCIAIALCRLWPGMRVLAVDCSADALSVARLNAHRLRVGSRMRFIRASSLNHPRLARYQGRIDLLIANPPYVPSTRLAQLEPRVREHEPIVALDGGPDGTTIVRMLLDHGPSIIRPGGLLALEVDSTHDRVLRRCWPAVEVERDLTGRVRYAFLRAGNVTTAS